MRLREDMPLFDMPAKMTKVFDADLRFAAIPKRDAQGRTVDLHALRHTFGTLLSKAGLPLQVVKRAMRHSDPKLTANVYTHLALVDMAGTVESLPDFSESPLALPLALPAVHNPHVATKNSAPRFSTVGTTSARSRKSLYCSHEVSAIKRHP